MAWRISSQPLATKLEGVAARTGCLQLSHALIRENPLTTQLPHSRRLTCTTRRGAPRAPAGIRLCHGIPNRSPLLRRASAQGGIEKAANGRSRRPSWPRTLRLRAGGGHYGRAIQALELSDQTGTQAANICFSSPTHSDWPDNRRKQSLRWNGWRAPRVRRGHWTVVAKALLLFSEVMRDSAGMIETLHRRMDEAIAHLPHGEDALRARLLGASSFASIAWKPVAERLAILRRGHRHCPGLGDAETLAARAAFDALTITGSRPAAGARERQGDESLRRKGATTMNAARRSTLARRGPPRHRACKRSERSRDRTCSSGQSRVDTQRTFGGQSWPHVARPRSPATSPQLKRARRKRSSWAGPKGFLPRRSYGCPDVHGCARKAGRAATRRHDEVVRVGRAFLQVAPAYKAWWAVLAVCDLDLGAEEEARAAFRRFADEGFDRLPDDPVRLALLFVLSLLASGLGEAAHARTLLRMLEAFRRKPRRCKPRVCVRGSRIASSRCSGENDGGPSAAQSHFERAMAEESRNGFAELMRYGTRVRRHEAYNDVASVERPQAFVERSRMRGFTETRREQAEHEEQRQGAPGRRATGRSLRRRTGEKQPAPLPRSQIEVQLRAQPTTPCKAGATCQKGATDSNHFIDVGGVLRALLSSATMNVWTP